VAASPDTYAPEPSSVICPHCDATHAGTAPTATMIYRAMLELRCSYCGGVWLEWRGVAGIERHWSPVENPPA
jgi:hypothetical protein